MATRARGDRPLPVVDRLTDPVWFMITDWFAIYAVAFVRNCPPSGRGLLKVI